MQRKDKKMDAGAALAEIGAWVTANGLTPHPAKTHAGDCRVAGQGFEFLGYRFEAGRRFVRKKSLDKLKDKILEKTGRCRGVSLEQVIADLNPVLRGWFSYFKQAHPTTFADAGGFIRRRLRSTLLKQRKRTHIGFGALIHKTWPNAYFADAGLFALQAAWKSARRPR